MKAIIATQLSKHRYWVRVATCWKNVSRRGSVARSKAQRLSIELEESMKEKGNHIQRQQRLRQILLAMTEVVLEVVALCFQRVEVLIFNFPATAACLHQLHHRLFADGVAGDPGVLKGDLPFVVENLQLHPGDYRAVLFRIRLTSLSQR